MDKCELTDIECEFWEIGEPGQCLAVFIEQCPYEDVEIKGE